MLLEVGVRSGWKSRLRTRQRRIRNKLVHGRSVARHFISALYFIQSEAFTVTLSVCPHGYHSCSTAEKTESETLTNFLKGNKSKRKVRSAHSSSKLVVGQLSVTGPTANTLSFVTDTVSVATANSAIAG